MGEVNRSSRHLLLEPQSGLAIALLRTLANRAAQPNGTSRLQLLRISPIRRIPAVTQVFARRFNEAIRLPEDCERRVRMSRLGNAFNVYNPPPPPHYLADPVANAILGARAQSSSTDAVNLLISSFCGNPPERLPSVLLAASLLLLANSLQEGSLQSELTRDAEKVLQASLESGSRAERSRSATAE